MNGAIEASKRNVCSIVSPTSHCYFDYSIEKIDLRKVYFFNPIPNEEMKDFILGGECNMWSERAPQELIDRKVFPRILAMSEVLWSKAKKNYPEFYQRVQRFYKLLDKLGVDYGEESKPIQIDIQKIDTSNGTLLSNVNLIPGGKNLQLYFSLDGKSFNLFNKTFQKEGEFKIYAKAMKNEKQYGDIEVSRIFNNLVLNQNYQLKYQPSMSYPGIGLTNGIRAPKKNFRDVQWMGFIQTNLEIIFKNEGKKVKSIRIGCLNDTISWIFFPSKIEILTSELDDQNFKIFDQIICENSKELSKKDFEFKTEISSEFIKIIVYPLDSIPEWHNGKGNKAWIFVDQIEME